MSTLKNTKLLFMAFLGLIGNAIANSSQTAVDKWCKESHNLCVKGSTNQCKAFINEGCKCDNEYAKCTRVNLDSTQDNTTFK